MQETIPQHSNSNISNITLLFSYENFQEKNKFVVVLLYAAIM